MLSAATPIAVVMSSFNPGGTERQMIELVRRLDRRRWQVEVACFQRRGAWLPRIGDSAPVSSFEITSLRRIAVVDRIRAFARWCTAKRIAIVHTTDLPTNIFGLPAAALAGVPVRIGNRREVNANRSLAELAVQRTAYSFAHAIIANCRAAADRLRTEGVAVSKIAVVPNGVEIPPVPCVRRSPPRRVVVVANLRPEKGHDVLIDAAGDVLTRFPDARFEFVGDGPERDRLVARARGRGVLGALTFAGHTDQVGVRLGESDVFVLPSRSEALPNALLEAMAAGLPVISSAIGGTTEVVDDQRTGLLVPAGDARALAGAICRIMASPLLAATLGEGARAAVRARHGFDRMVAGFDALYWRELSRRGLVPAAERELAAC